ncbi:TonB dependent receptor [Filimonas effusa]|uniref:TonB-dependent receptor n=1 Tax=Filimonas effusa TaxID=2508721 RepID=A0A4Q1D4L5_9BACT|nr:TonB dependent receptor [Filimonas effusa]RXK83422.1 TonB-dependent receptor [Filimonas effusa]
MNPNFSLTILVFLLFAHVTQAQQISGTVRDADNKPVAHAVVSLLRLPDSLVLKNEVTDKNGAFRFAGVAAGTYFLNVTYIGYVRGFSGAFVVTGKSGITVSTIVLSKAVADLQGVTVTSKKPMIEVKADKTIVNVENTINAIGNDVLELLRRSPGVLVDKDENISLSGKNGVQVFIDGKPSPFSGKDLSAYLKAMQSDQVESIELITNPSAKYEAAGNAGIINIRLKKNKAFGTNGTVSAGYNIGIYSKYNGSFAINHRNKKLNFFGNYNYNKSRNESSNTFYRELLDSVFDQHAFRTITFEGNSFRGGIDYYANRNNTFGIAVMGNVNKGTYDMLSNNVISYAPAGKPDRLLEAANMINDKRNNLNTNLNYRFADTLGHEFNVDADYGSYTVRTGQFQPNIYYTPSHSAVMSKAVYRMSTPTDIKTYALRADYEQDYKKGKLSIGIKSSLVDSDNDLLRYNVWTNKESLDTLRSNIFNYNENINAGYVNYNKQFKGVMLQAGLRVENTNSKGTSIGHRIVNDSYAIYDSSFERNYTDLFPSAAITWNKHPGNQWSLSYSRRIDRPAYKDLNPFEFKLDEYTYEKGNTQLKPQYTHSVRMTNVYKYKLTTALGYSRVTDVFTQLPDTADRSKAYVTWENLASQDAFSLDISLPVQYNKYTGFLSISSNYSHYRANLGEGRTIDHGMLSVNLYMQHSYKFSKRFTGEISGFYNSPTINQGTFRSRKQWTLNAGGQYSFAGERMLFKVSVSDLFHMLQWWSESDFAGQRVVANGKWESRQLKLNLSWRFGSSQVKASRQRKTASEEESRRINSGGN